MSGPDNWVTSVPDCDGIDLADLTGNGKTDIVVCQSVNGKTEWWEQGATVYDWTRHEIGTGLTKIEGIVVADFDDDGDLEVVALDQGGGRVVLYKPATYGDPTGAWTATTLVTGRANAQDGQAIDIDGDGIPELVYTFEGANSGQGGVHWLDFDGADVNDAADWTDYTMTDHPGAWWLASSGRVDLSGSGRGDIVFSSRDSRNTGPTPGVYWLEAPADPTGTWTKRTIESRDADWRTVDVGDFSGNGHGKDVICADVDGTYGPQWYDFSDSWAATPISPGHYTTTLTWNCVKYPTITGNTRDALLLVGDEAIVVCDWDGYRWRTRTLLTTGYVHAVDDRVLFDDLDGSGDTKVILADSDGNRLMWYSLPDLDGSEGEPDPEPPPFSDPSDLADLVLWLDASQETAYSNGDGVSVATDFSGEGNDTDTQATAGQRPTYTTNAKNSLPAFSLDGGDFLALPTSLFDIAAGTTFIVAQTADTGGNDHMVAAQEASTDRWFLSHSSANWAVRVGQGGFQTVGSVDGNWHAVALRANGTAKTGWFDGTQTASFAEGNTGRTDSLAGLGGLNSGNWVGYIAEVIHYDRALTDAEMDDVHDYLIAKWGL